MAVVEIDEHKLVEMIVDELNYEDLARAVLESDEFRDEVANRIGVEEVADHIGAEAVAEHIDLEKLAEHLPQTDVQNQLEEMKSEIEELKVKLGAAQEALDLMPVVAFFDKLKLMRK